MKRRDNSIEKLEKEIVIGEYKIKGDYLNGTQVYCKNLYLFKICYYKNSTTNCTLHLNGEYLSKNLTRDEILKYLDNTVSKEVIIICLNKLKLIEELDSLFMYYKDQYSEN